MRCRSERNSSPSKSLTSLGCAILCLLLGQTNGSWVDPDTPQNFRSTTSMTAGDDRQYKLVFSDEFEQEGRTFHDGQDPRWTALHKNDYTNAALHFYSHDNAITTNGVLNITTERKDNNYKAFNEKSKKFYADTKHIQSAMLQSWNKFCFTGGIVEFSAKLPGDSTVGGLWPALWMLGNLARATYVGSSDYVWPYSYNKCNPDKRMSQEINACDKVNHYGLAPSTGRGAPEIDVIEAMQGDAEKLPSTTIRRPYQSASLQVAPGIDRDRPNLGSKPHKGHWYTGMEYASGDNMTHSELNPFFYGVTLVHDPKSYTYQADAISANRQLSADHYVRQHTYRVEWEPPDEDGTGGYIHWYTDGKFAFAVRAANLKITGSEIPSEPMYLIMNTAVSHTWGFPAPCPDGCKCSCFECGNPDCACALPTGYCENFPANFEIDHVRVFQAVNETKHVLGCSPAERPTELFIKGHAERYMEGDQKRPLEPIQRGGSRCLDDSTCGFGVCSAKGICICERGFTGPTCLAHDGFYVSEDISLAPEEVEVHEMVIPRGLVAIVVVLFVLFLISMTGALRDKTRATPYQKLTNVPGIGDAAGPAGAISYQHQTEFTSDPNKQKVVTYCVIDGRLVDS